jgi:hypothetical protein
VKLPAQREQYLVFRRSYQHLQSRLANDNDCEWLLFFVREGNHANNRENVTGTQSRIISVKDSQSQ